LISFGDEEIRDFVEEEDAAKMREEGVEVNESDFENF
jgi:hypothetical protein